MRSLDARVMRAAMHARPCARRDDSGRFARKRKP